MCVRVKHKKWPISSSALTYTNTATPYGPTRCALGSWGENFGDKRKLLGELLMELKLEKQVQVHEEQERKGRRGAPRATEALGQRPGHFWGAERGRRVGQGQVRPGQVGTGKDRSQQVGCWSLEADSFVWEQRTTVEGFEPEKEKMTVTVGGWAGARGCFWPGDH